MRTRQLLPARGLIAAALLGSLCAVKAGAQVNSAAPRITQAVNDSNLVVLRGNVHPLARAAYDRGPVPASLSMQHMLLVLKRSPQQEASLEELLAEQQDKSSPDYHKWLTPAEFGAQFGPSDSDIQTVESWLRSQGFAVNGVSTGRVVIDFSGTAAQVQGAFHTAIHRYVLPTGAQHWANSTDPQIPAALAPVVAGIRSLNNFFPKPNHSTVRRNALRPAFTYPNGCTADFSASNNCFFDVTPADFDTIYNVPPTATGTGETIAIISDSDVSAADLQQFRSIFGMPAMTAIGPNSAPDTSGCAPRTPSGAPCFVQFVPPGSGDPGIQCPAPGQSFSPASCTSNTNGDESEAALDVEWGGVAAPSANIWLISSADTSSQFGGDLSATYVVNCPTANATTCPVAVPANVLTTSYGACELVLGTTGNQFYNSTWQQAAAEGITILASSGDSGSAGCDFFDPTSSLPQPAEAGLAVNGVASTPYNVAIGGTDFNQVTDPSQFWNTTSSGTGESAKGYIPELAWNDSCTNSLFGSNILANCNNPNLDLSGANDYNFIWTEGAGGGMSGCTSSISTATTLSQALASCANPYPKPSWQQGNGVPADGVRDVPDVSLFASNGFLGTAYIVCEADTPAGSPNSPPGQGGTACSLSSPPSSAAQASFEEFGGTSVSVQIFGGIVALMDQAAGGNKQGNINPILYALANQSGNTCTSAANPAASCTFYDVQSGTITQPCNISFPGITNKSPDCGGGGNDTIGILELNKTDAYNAGPGYDLATGLGTVNVGNLIGHWPTTGDFILSSTDPFVTIPSASSSGTFSFTITSENGFSGSFDFSSASCSGLPSGFTCAFSPASASLSTGNPISETVTIQSSTAPAAVWPGSDFWGGNRRDIEIPLEFGLALAALALAFAKRRQFRWLALAVLFVGLGAAAGCSGGTGNGSSGNNGGGGNGATTATMTVVSGSISHSMNFQVTVK